MSYVVAKVETSVNANRTVAAVAITTFMPTTQIGAAAPEANTVTEGVAITATTNITIVVPKRKNL